MPFHGPNADRVSIHLGREIKNSAPMVQPMNKLTPRLPPPPPPPPPLAFFRQACFEQLVLEKNSTDPSDRRSGKERRGSRTAPSLVHNKSTDSPDRSPPSTSNDNTTNGSDGSACVRARSVLRPTFLSLSLSPPSPSLSSAPFETSLEGGREERRAGPSFSLFWSGNHSARSRYRRIKLASRAFVRVHS